MILLKLQTCSWVQGIMKGLVTNYTILYNPINNQHCHLEGLGTVTHRRMTEIQQDPEELYPDSVAQHLQGMALTTALKEAVRPLEAAWKPVVIHMGKRDVLLIMSPQEFQIKKYVGLCSSWMVSTVVPGLCPRCQKSTELKNVVHKQSFTGNL